MLKKDLTLINEDLKSNDLLAANNGIQKNLRCSPSLLVRLSEFYKTKKDHATNHQNVSVGVRESFGMEFQCRSVCAGRRPPISNANISEAMISRAHPLVHFSILSIKVFLINGNMQFLF